MAQIKSYTSLEQAKVLLKILPHQSADMSFNVEKGYEVILHPYMTSPWIGVPCWSLAALLGVLPKTIDHETLFIETSPALWHIGYRNVYTARTDNPVDTCYELALKLNELNLL